MEAHVLSLNEFSKPLVLDKTNAVYTHIIYLLLCSKGQFQSHPNMGVGLRERYRYNTDENFLSNLKTDIRNQMEQYLPEVAALDIGLTVKDHVLGIIIDTSDGTYVMAYDSNKNDIEAAATYVLSDL